MERLLVLALFLAPAAQAEKAPTTRQVSIYLLGPSGAGKSMFGNALTQNSSDEEMFSVGQGGPSHTKLTGWRKTFFTFFDYLTGAAKPNAPEAFQIELTVGDTAGLADTDGETTKLLDQTMATIRETRPHAIILVVKAGRNSLDGELSFRLLAETLGSALLSDFRRIALFVNMLPTDFQYESNKSIQPSEYPADRQRLVDEARNTVCDYLGLSEHFYIRTAIGNTFGTWDGRPAVQQFLAGVPHTPIDVSKIRTWTEVKKNIESAIVNQESAEKEVTRQILSLETKIKTIYENKIYFEGDEGSWWATFQSAGMLVCAVAAGASYTMWLPGMQVPAAAATLAAAGCVTVQGATWAEIWKLDEAWQEAKQELKLYLDKRPAERVRAERTRLQAKLNKASRLERIIDRKEL